MSRQKTKINPVRAERVKIIIEREKAKREKRGEKYTQTQFAEDIHTTQQNVSRIINMKNALTEETAQAIIEAYPDYRIEWLLGYDSAPTWYEWADNVQKVKDVTADSMWAIFERSLNKKGLSLKFHHRAGIHLDSTQRLHGDCFYTVEDHEGKEVKRLTAVQMVELEQKIQEYADFICEKYLE